MQICIIANGYPDSREPQWGCFERDQALALKELGHDVEIIYVDRRFRKYWRKIGFSHFVADGLSVFGIFLFPGAVFQRIIPAKLYQKIMIWMYDRVYRLCVRQKGTPDILFAHYIWNIFYATFLKEKYGVPLVGIEHWSGLTAETLSPRSLYQGKNAYFKVDKLLAVSQSLQSHIYRHFKKESIVVYDMLGQEFISSEVQKEKSNRFRFVAVGSLLPIKDYEMLIEAFSKSKLADEGCSLSIIGDGAERSKLENTILELNLKNSVSLLGRKTKNEIVNILSECHVFVLSSQAETFGVACIEALSQGLPAIATRCGGPEEFIDEKNGLLVEPHNSDEMAIAMRKTYENYSKYDTLKIAESCRNRFAPDVIAKQLSELMGGGNFQFIAIGSLIYRKGFDILIEAFAKTDLAEKGCSVIIVGEGSEKANLQKQIERLGVTQSVQLVGRKTKKEIIDLMRESYVFILSSRAETFGVVCIEALSQGLPNIASICGGPEEFINDSNGVLIPTDDVDAMSKAMIKMYNDFNMYDRSTIAKDCKRKFAPQVIAQQLTNIFEEVIKK